MTLKEAAVTLRKWGTEPLDDKWLSGLDLTLLTQSTLSALWRAAVAEQKRDELAAALTEIISASNGDYRSEDSADGYVQFPAAIVRRAEDALAKLEEK